MTASRAYDLVLLADLLRDGGRVRHLLQRIAHLVLALLVFDLA